MHICSACKHTLIYKLYTFDKKLTCNFCYCCSRVIVVMCCLLQDGESPLDLARKNGHDEVVAYLDQALQHLVCGSSTLLLTRVAC